MTLNRGTTERGFAIYDEFADTYGTVIRIQKSSIATDLRCWIFTEGGTGSPHLNIEQAKRVRDALDTFIRECATPDPTGRPEPVGGAGGDGHVHLHVHGPVGSQPQLEQWLVTSIRKAVKIKGAGTGESS